MWSAWRRRTLRDGAVTLVNDALGGDLVAQFDRVFYVATTPPDQPLERLAITGLTYRGYCSINVLSDGVRIQVAGEPTVPVPARDIDGVSVAQLRIDKVVERDGLTVFTWRVPERTLESSFRFAEPKNHTEFERAVNQITHAQPLDNTPNTLPGQEI